MAARTHVRNHWAVRLRHGEPAGPTLSTGMDVPESPVLAALYAGEPARARELARGRELDVFEAAAVGDSGRLADLLAGDPPAARARTADGFTALHYAAFFSRNADCARALLDAGAEPDAVADNDTDLRPINSAAGSGASEIVALLLERGADVDAAQRGGYTALHSAAHDGNEELARMLLAAGADPARATDDDRTPADLAAEAGHPKLARALAS